MTGPGITEAAFVRVGGAMISETGGPPVMHVAWSAPSAQVFLLPEQAEIAAQQLLQAAAAARAYQTQLADNPGAVELARAAPGGSA